MGVSLAFVAVLIVIDILLLTTFWTLKNLRRLTDARMSQTKRSNSSQNEDDDNVALEQNDKAIDGENRHTSGNAEMSDMCGCVEKELQTCYGVWFGWLFGYTYLDDNYTQQFPKWKPLPYKIGAISTCILLAMSAILLSPDVIFAKIGMTTGSKNPEICSLGAEMDTVQEKLMQVSNMEVARRQLNYTIQFYEALVNDTTLFGTTGHECKDIVDINGNILAPGTKDDWLTSNDGTFFPGYCEDALEAALFSSRHTQCTQKVCGCKFGVCLGGVTKVCIDTPYVCDRHTNDQEEELNDYRLEQQRRGSITGDTFINVTQFSDEMEMVKEIAEDIVSKVFRQVDIAGSIYIAYICLALFFPSPLILFQSPHTNKIKRTLFGVQRHVFILWVVAIWWGVEYFHHIRLLTPEFIPDLPTLQLYIKKLQVNPCYANPKFLQDREKALATTCMEMMEARSEWERSSSTIRNILSEVHHFVNTCDCSFPMKNLASFLSPDIVSSDVAEELGFVGKVDNICTSCEENQNIFVPGDEFSFLGNTTICTETDYAWDNLFESPDFGLTWSDVWIKTGIVAKLIIKFVVSNCCLNLLRVVDPFTDCGGTFEQPPRKYFNIDSVNMVEVQNFHITVLSRIAMIRSFFWVVLMQWCVLTLAFGVFNDFKENNLELERDDMLIGSVLLSSVPVILFITILVNVYMKKEIKSLQKVSLDQEDLVPVGMDQVVVN